MAGTKARRIGGPPYLSARAAEYVAWVQGRIQRAPSRGDLFLNAMSAGHPEPLMVLGVPQGQ